MRVLVTGSSGQIGANLALRLQEDGHDVFGVEKTLDFTYVAHLEKPCALLGYEPQVPLEEGIPRMVAWFVEHRAAHPAEEELPLADSAPLGIERYA